MRKTLLLIVVLALATYNLQACLINLGGGFGCQPAPKPAPQPAPAPKPCICDNDDRSKFPILPLLGGWDQNQNCRYPPPPPQRCEPERLSNKFTLTFDYACRPGVAHKSCLGEVIWNNVIILSINPSDYSFRKAKFEVVVQPGRNSLQFVGAGTSDSYGLLIDNVALVRERTSTNIVVNGDFENPCVKGSWGIFNDIDGWKGEGIQIGDGRGAYGIGNSQVCQLDGNGNYQITQYFTFDHEFRQVANSDDSYKGRTLTYKLQFDWAIRTTVCDTETSKAVILWNDKVIASLQFTGHRGINRASFDVPLRPGNNILQFDGAGKSDAFGLTIDNVRLTSSFNNTNLIVNGDFSNPCIGGNWQYFDGGIAGWSGAKVEIGKGKQYNQYWTPTSAQCLQLDSDTNQRVTQVISISPSLFDQLVLQSQKMSSGRYHCY